MAVPTITLEVSPPRKQGVREAIAINLLIRNKNRPRKEIFVKDATYLQ